MLEGDSGGLRSGERGAGLAFSIGFALRKCLLFALGIYSKAEYTIWKYKFCLGGIAMSKRFLVRLDWDDEYKGYVVNVPSLPGCMSQGKTEQEALDNISDAIKLYLEFLRETGQPIPVDDGDVYTVEVAA